jgi:hypothetical protein
MLSGDDRETVDAVLRGGFAMLKSIRSRPDSPYWRHNPELLVSSLLSIGNALNRPPWTEFEHWLGLVGEQGIDLIVEAAGHPDPQIQTLALDFLLKFKDPIIGQIEPKMQSEEYRQNENYIRGALNVTSRLPEKRELLLHLQEQPWIQSHPRYKQTIEVNVSQMEIERPEGLNPNLERVIELAWALKERNIRYRWGGRSEDEGFDSAGFIAYILNRSEVHQAQRLKDPGLWRAGALREVVGERRPENHPQEVGDLVFYMDGFVMLYLGENRIIGMTERGIIVNNYLEFHGNPIQVNKVVYE